MELELDCREDVEVRECFSSPEILELKAECELVRYRGAVPSRLQCPFGLTGPVFKVVLRHLCRRRDLPSVLEIRVLCAQCHGCRKNNNHSFHHGSARVLSSDEANFLCAFPHFAVWSRDSSQIPVIHLLLLLYPKIWLNFKSSQQILTNF